MNHRDVVLKWLAEQALEHAQCRLRDPKTAESCLAKAKDQSIEIQSSIALAFDDELIWDLAVNASITWFEPSLTKLNELDESTRAYVLHLALSLADEKDSQASVWLAFAAHSFDLGLSGGLVQDRLHDLVGRMPCSERIGGFRNVIAFLSCLDSMIEDTDSDRREHVGMIAINLVNNWAHIPGLLLKTKTLLEDGASIVSGMADWAIKRTNEIIAPQSASYALRARAYQSTCSIIAIEGHEELNVGRLKATEVVTWYEERVDTIIVPRQPAESQLLSPRRIAESESYIAIVRCADWLVNHGSPEVALTILNELPEGYQDSSAQVTRASAIASLGRVSQALRESKFLPPKTKPGHWWLLARLLYETGDDKALQVMRTVVEMPGMLDFSEVRTRMRLLLAEREIEEGDPKKALQLVVNMLYVDAVAVTLHARVIFGEACVALANCESDDAAEWLECARVAFIAVETETKDGNDDPDRLRTRALVGLGEVHWLSGDRRLARSLLRKAMALLDLPAPSIEESDSQYREGRSTFDTFQLRFSRRPWNRSWASAAELSLISELIDDPDAESAFSQLQRYRTITHTGTIAELTGFTPNAALDADRRKLLEQLRSDAGQLEAQIEELHREVHRIENDRDFVAANADGSGGSRSQLASIRERIQKKASELERKHKGAATVEKEAEETRGYLSSPAGIRHANSDDIVRALTSADAAVVELVRLNGAQWGLPSFWFAFVVTPDGIEIVDLPGADIDRELRRVRSHRSLLDGTTLQTLSELIIGRLPKTVTGHRNLCIAADGDAWAIPFRSLRRPRWRIVPWKLANGWLYANWPVPETVKRVLDWLSVRMDKYNVTNVVSTSHFVRLLNRTKRHGEHPAVVVGSMGGSSHRGLCEGLARSLEKHPPNSGPGTRWVRYSGELGGLADSVSKPPDWMAGESSVFLASWHTSFTADPRIVAQFHLDDGVMTLAEFLSHSRQKCNIAVILSCNVSLPRNSDERAFAKMGSTGFGLIEALQADALVASTNEVTADVAFVLGRFLSAEFGKGKDVHTALATAQKRLRHCKVAEIIEMLGPIEDNVPETKDWLMKLASEDPNDLAFPKICDTEPFYVLGLPTAKLHVTG